MVKYISLNDPDWKTTKLIDKRLIMEQTKNPELNIKVNNSKSIDNHRNISIELLIINNTYNISIKLPNGYPFNPPRSGDIFINNICLKNIYTIKKASLEKIDITKCLCCNNFFCNEWSPALGIKDMLKDLTKFIIVRHILNIDKIINMILYKYNLKNICLLKYYKNICFTNYNIIS